MSGRIEIWHTATREIAADTALVREALRGRAAEPAELARRLAWDRARVLAALQGLRSEGLARECDGPWALTSAGRQESL